MLWGNIMPTPLTIIFPYYRQPQMLAYQLAIWNIYPTEAQIILVDDGSPEPAIDVIVQHAHPELFQHMQLYRIVEDVPWNREEARNLGAGKAQTEWIVQLDLDHVLPVSSVQALLAYQSWRDRHYRFPRWRRGIADDTRRKDCLKDECPYGPIHPHMDSYLVRKEAYWQAGGYNEAFAGVLGGGSEFLTRLCAIVTWEVLPLNIPIEVITRFVVPDSSISTLSRDTEPGKARWRALQGKKPTTWLVHPWERIL